MKLIKNTRDHPGHLARALPLAAASDIPNVITPRKPLRRVLTSIALPLAALGLGQLVPCAQAQSLLPVTSGLQCWYDAAVGVTGSGAGVTGWADQSGNGHTATKTAGTLTLISSALNGRPAIQFSGNAVASMTGNMYSKTQFIVTKMNGGDWGAWMGSQVQSGYMWNQSGNCWNGNVPAAASKNGTALSNPFYLGDDRATNYMILKIVGNDSNTSQRLYELGRQQGWNSLHNFMAEIIVYNRVLTSTEENLVGGYLAKKYAVSTTYPTYPLMVSVTSPADTQAYPTNTSVTAVATVPSLAGTGPYSVQFHKKVGAGAFAAEGSPVSGAGPTFSLPLGTLTDNTYQIYATVTDNVSATATSATNTFTVAPPISTTTTLGSSPNPSTYGQTVTFTATVSGPPTGGTVQFYSDTIPLGSPVAVNTGTGAASTSTTLLTVPTHAITAHYSGHGVYLASDASALSQTVNQAVLTVTADNKVRSPGSANPTFTYKITGYQNAENATSAGVSGAPVLSCLADASSSVGPYDITCAVGSLTAANYSFTAVKGTLTVMVGAPPVANGMVCWFDASNGVDAPGGAISQWNDLSGNGHHAAAAGGTKTLAANQLNGKSAAQFRGGYLNCAGTFFAKEQYVVVRSPYSDHWGYGAFFGRASGRGSNVMMADDKPTFWNDQSPDAVVKNGTAVTRDATPLNGNYTYNVAPIDTFMLLKIVVNNNDTSAAAYRIANSAGSTLQCDIAEIVAYDTALSSADEAKVGRYLADKYAITAAYPLVNPPLAPTSLTAEGLLNAIRLTWPAAYSASGYNVYRGTTTGVYDPTPIATGVSTIPWTDSTVTAGTPYFYVVKAVNSAGEGAPSPEANATATSGKVDQTITFGPLAAKTYLDPNFALTATASSFLPVSYEIVAPDPLVVSISGSTVTILKAGTVTIRAIQPGDTAFNAATPVEQTLTVNKANQALTLTLGSSLVKGSNAAPFADPATTTNPSGNPVTYSSTVETVATVDASSGMVTIVGVGTTQIRADQAGIDEYYNAAPQVSQTLIVISAGMLPVTNGLACWYDAGQGVTEAGGGVTTWADSSTLGHTATRASGTVTLAANDINGKPAVHLRGTNTYLSCAGGMFTKEQYLVVRSPNATWNGSGSFLGRQSDVFLAVRSSSYNMSSGTTGFWRDHWPMAVSKNGTPVAAGGGDVNFLLNPITDYMLLKITVDNQASAANLAAYPYYNIGKNETLGTMDFDVAEIIGYDHALTSQEAGSVTAYLAQKFGVVVAFPTSFSNLSASQSISAGTSSVTLSGTLSAPGPVYPAAGELVAVTINGVTQNATVSGTAGHFSLAFSSASIPTSVTPYPITYSYAGNATQLGAASSNTSTALTVTEAVAGYDNWASQHAGSQTAEKDYNNDGVQNGIAYFMGATGVATQPGIENGQIVWPHDATATGVTWKVLTSEDLQSWTDVTADAVDAGGLVTYTPPKTTLKLFVRLEVIAP